MATRRKTSERSSAPHHSPLANPIPRCISLAYPHPSTFPENETFFPLHRDILLAVVRNLLIIDGSVDGKTLLVIRNEGVKACDNPYMRHLGLRTTKKKDEEVHSVTGSKSPSAHSGTGNSSRNIVKQRENEGTNSETTATNSQRHARKRKRPTTILPPSRLSFLKKSFKKKSQKTKRTKCPKDVTATPAAVSPVTESETPPVVHHHATPSGVRKKMTVVIEEENTDPESSDQILEGEELANLIIDRAIRRAHLNNLRVGHLATPKPSPSKRPRTVSVDWEDGHVLDGILSSNANRDDRTLAAGNDDDASCLLPITTAQESVLRDLSHRMTREILSTFSPTASSEFLEQKRQPQADRETGDPDRGLILSSLLFYASHALFAFEQTRVEYLQERRASPVPSRDDGVIFDLLFDGKSRKRIGGLEDVSLIPQALGIKRCRSNAMKWTRFAKSGLGRRVLEKVLHKHRSWERGGRIGRKGRGGYYGYYHHHMLGCEKQDRGRKGSVSDGEEEIVSSSSFTWRDYIPLRMEREDLDVAWGAALSRENDLCVVLRTNDHENQEKETKDSNIFCLLEEGDIVVSIHDEISGKMLEPPSFARSPPSFEKNGTLAGRPRKKEQGLSWFQDMVTLFRESKVLNVRVRRVVPLLTMESRKESE